MYVRLTLKKWSILSELLNKNIKIIFNFQKKTPKSIAIKSDRIEAFQRNMQNKRKKTLIL